MTSNEYGKFMSYQYIHKLRSLKESEHIKKESEWATPGIRLF